MDTEKVQSLIVRLAKSGDKQTLQDVAELLNEVSKYSGNTTTRQEPKREQRQAPMKENYSISSHASDILDGGSMNIYTPQPVRTERSQPVDNSYMNAFSAFDNVAPAPTTNFPTHPDDVPYVPGPRNLAHRPEITSHADLLL